MSVLAAAVSRRRKRGTGLPLSRVCKTASGNTVRRWKPLRATRTPWNIVKPLGTPFPPTSSTSIFHDERRSSTLVFSNTSRRHHPSTRPYSLPCRTMFTLTDEITHIAPMTMDVMRSVNCWCYSLPSFNDRWTSRIGIRKPVTPQISVQKVSSFYKNFHFFNFKTNWNLIINFLAT